MADKKATLTVKLKDEASNAMKGLNNSISDYKYAILAVVGAIAGFVTGMYSLVSSYLESEKAVNKLNMAMKRRGKLARKFLRGTNRLLSQGWAKEKLTSMQHESKINYIIGLR